MDTVKGTLKHGLKIGAATHRDYELRELTTQDIFSAEAVADSDKPLTFGGALICLQLVRIGSYTGPFTLELIGKLKPADYAELRAAQQQAETLGEAAAGATATGTPASSS